MKLNGKWKGYYQYGAGYTLPEFGQKVKISVTFSESKNGFNGNMIEEESEISVPHESTLKGMLEDDIITFNKRYPTISKSGFMDIEHEGFVDEKNKAIYGSWLMTTEEEDDDGTYDSFSEGIWFLEKV